MDFEQYVINALNEIKATNEKTLIQTTKTNGRVNTLEEYKEKEEKRVNELVAESNKTKGRDKVLLAIALCVGTILGFITQDFIQKILTK